VAARSAVIMNCHTLCKENEDNVATKKLLTTGSKDLIENCKISFVSIHLIELTPVGQTGSSHPCLTGVEKN